MGYMLLGTLFLFILVGVITAKIMDRRQKAEQARKAEEDRQRREAERAERERQVLEMAERKKNLALEAAAKKGQRLRERGKVFELELSAIPRAEIHLEPRAVTPDADPDLAAVTYRRVTRATSEAVPNNFVAVDVETTGLDPDKNDIVQIAAVRFQNGKAVECFVSYVKPKNGIQEKAARINGITGEMVSTAPEIDCLVNAFRRFTAGKTPIVGHNLSFDLGFLVKAGCLSLNDKRAYYDTLSLSRSTWKLDSYRLDDLERNVFSLRRQSAHDALSDAYLTGLLFKSICQIRANK